MERRRPTTDKPKMRGRNLISAVKWQMALKKKKKKKKKKKGVMQGLCTWSKTCPSVPPSTTNPTWAGLGQNLGFRGGRPAISYIE